MSEPDEPIHELPLTGEIDLHTFAPREVADVVESFVEAHAEAGLRSLRIIHGKGTGQLRERVHSVLRKLPQVESFKLGGPGAGGWGATLVELKAPRRG